MNPFPHSLRNAEFSLQICAVPVRMVLKNGFLEFKNMGVEKLRCRSADACYHYDPLLDYSASTSTRWHSGPYVVAAMACHDNNEDTERRRASPNQDEGPSGKVCLAFEGVGGPNADGQKTSCKPCSFFVKQRCRYGEQCSHCHVHAPQKRPPLKVRRRRIVAQGGSKNVKTTQTELV